MIEVATTERIELINITDRVTEAIPPDATGSWTVFVPHTTAGVIVNEHEPRLIDDITRMLTTIVPEPGDYAHDEIDNNAAAHLRSIVLGEHVTIPVSDGGLSLGTWQSILFVECDGPRSRRVVVSPSQ